MTRRRRTRVRRLLFCVPGLVLALATGCTEVSVDPPDPSGLDAGQRLERGQQALSAFVAALNERDEAAYAEATDPRFADRTAPVLDNADLLEVGPIEAEYVDSIPGGLGDEEVERFGPEAWLASARLRYTLGVDGDADSGHEIALVVTPEGDSARIAALGGHGQRSPLWLTGPVEVARSGGVTVINAGGGPAEPLVRQGVRAIRDVRSVLPGWDGRLVIEVPADKDGLDRTLAADPDTYANIAAVTSTADGSVVPGAPVHVFLNPQVFGTLKARGAQVVVSHEATHVATDASFTAMPIWLLEGFADYVALKDAGVPVQRAAAQVIERMRKDGLPDSLPTPEDLQPTAEGLGATYEEAWLACRSLAMRWGEPALVRFHRTVADGTGTEAAFREVLGVSEERFVELWRADLEPLVDGRMAG